jgi:hypothetical protein
MSKAYPQQLKRVLAENPFRNLKPGPHDVIVMTYAKSGTNWMMQIAHQLIWHGKGEFDHLHEVVPWPDSELMSASFIRKYAISLDDATQWQQAPERKRVIKTHFNFDHLPYSPQAHYIAVIRDPKDIFVSSYFFARDSILGKSMPSVKTWYDMFLSENFMIGGSWAVNAASYWAVRDRPNVRIFSFKEMKRDLPGVVRQVAEFLKIPAGEELLAEVTRQSSFDYMKKIDHKFHIGKVKLGKEPGKMIRSGKQGGASELLTPEQQREMDRYFQAELKRLNCDLPYEEFADLAR